MMRRGPSRRAARRTVRRVSRRRVRMRRRRMLLTGGMVAIAVAGTATAIKLSQQDAQRIEQHTGKKPEDLTEDQLDQAIADLNIEAAELTDAEVAAIESADAQPAAAAPQSTPVQQPPAPPAQLDYITELKKLAELRDMGIITADDFEAKKKQLLGL
ncbi:MAG: SHOCT domain-containing protein [Chloroflexi bacterium]|nr:SHOCT domain-containing protein [Chloroflexota bacterium]